MCLIATCLQINDSFIITKTLAPILFGDALSPAELELEELVTYGLMLAFEREAFADPDCMAQVSHHTALQLQCELLARANAI